MSARPVNVGGLERLAAGVLAGKLLVSLVRRPGVFKLLVLGSLLYRASRGHCYGYEWLGTDTCQIPSRS